jgi:hypothetical protein
MWECARTASVVERKVRTNVTDSGWQQRNSNKQAGCSRISPEITYCALMFLENCGLMNYVGDAPQRLYLATVGSRAVNRETLLHAATAGLLAIALYGATACRTIYGGLRCAGG